MRNVLNDVDSQPVLSPKFFNFLYASILSFQADVRSG